MKGVGLVAKISEHASSWKGYKRHAKKAVP
jgi:hypothetical protein